MPLDPKQEPPYYTIDETTPNAPDLTIAAEYRAMLTQTGTNDPTATEATSNTLTSITWTRTATGIYLGTKTGAFPTNKTWLTIAAIDTNANNLTINIISNNQVQIVTRNSAQVTTDGILTNTQITITITN